MIASRIRVWLAVGGLAAAVSACATPPAPYPVLAELPAPKASSLPATGWQKLLADIQKTGAANQEAGRMVRNAEELSRPLPK